VRPVLARLGELSQVTRGSSREVKACPFCPKLEKGTKQLRIAGKKRRERLSMEIRSSFLGPYVKIEHTDGRQAQNLYYPISPFIFSVPAIAQILAYNSKSVTLEAVIFFFTGFRTTLALTPVQRSNVRTSSIFRQRYQ
jgi:hypothetical protein